MLEADTSEPQPKKGQAATSVAGNSSPPAERKSAPETRFQEIARKLRWRMHWIAPNHIPAREDSAFLKANELASNEGSRVDPSQELRVPALWAVEIFGPNETDGLYASLKSLGWSAGLRNNDDGALTWIRAQRAYGHAGGYYNVGLVTRSSDRHRFLGDSNEAAIPNEVDYLLVRIFQVVPAVTAVVVCFVLKPEGARRYESELNLDRRSSYQRGPRWRVSRWQPSHTKQLAIQNARTQLRGIAYRWFSQNLPGFFARQRRPGRLPVAELLITRSENVLSDRSTSRHFDWKRIVINVAAHETWTSKSTPAMMVAAQPARWPSEETNHWTVGLCTDSLPPDRVQAYGGGPGAVVYICHEALDGVMAYHSVATFLKDAARDLKVTREELGLGAINRGSLRTVEHIQEFFDRNGGVPTIARELRDDSNRVGQYRHHCGRFAAHSWDKGGPERELAEELRLTVHAAAVRLIEDESSTREHFEQLSTVLSIRESIRTQRRMEWLTVVALVVATLSLIVAMPDPWIAWLKSVWRTVWG